MMAVYIVFCATEISTRATKDELRLLGSVNGNPRLGDNDSLAAR